MSDEMGFEQRLFIGTAGTTAATQVSNARDADYDLTPEKGPTTVRGTGAAKPITTENVTALGVNITWSMQNDPADTELATLIAAAITGAAIALLLKTKFTTDDTIFDGDVTIAKKWNAPLSGEGSYDFVATPTKSAGRSPTLG